MLRKFHLLAFIGVLTGLTLAACGGLPTAGPVTDDTGALYTQAAQTVIARLTQDAGQIAVARLTEMAGGEGAKLPSATPTTGEEIPFPATATATHIPTETPQPTATLPPTATTVPTATPVPPTPTPTPIPCDWAAFVKDVSVIDGTQFNPGATFTKTWRLQNIGSCTWTRDYSLVFVSGSQMDGVSKIWLDTQVRPGEMVDVSVQLKAPARVGDYTGHWQLRNESGVNFGVGNGAKQAFWVMIRVSEPTKVVLDLADNYCSAEWRNRLELVSCPGKLTDIDSGFVLVVDEPSLENGTKENEPAIVVRPDSSTGGLIQGRFPPFKVQIGDRFRTAIGCMADSPGCSVVFQLNYRVDGGGEQNLGTWTEVFDKSINKLDIDLGPLAGKSVELILTVYNNGNSADDNVFWLLPRILR